MKTYKPGAYLSLTMPAYDDLLQSLYATMHDEEFEESARAWVSNIRHQPELYQKLLTLQPAPEGECVYLEPALTENEAPDILYKRICNLKLKRGALWPAGDYNTIGQAVADVNWPATFKWSKTGHEVGSVTDEHVVSFCVWESFGVPYFNALWCSMNVDHIPPSVFMFVYSGGGAGVCIQQDDKLVGFTALHCVSFERQRATKCIIMNSIGKVGIFNPTIKDRPHDYAFGDLIGVEGIEPAPRLSSTSIATEVVAYGAPSGRATYARTDMRIKWAWMVPIRYELLREDATTTLWSDVWKVKEKEERPMTPRAWINEIDKSGKVGNWTKNYFHAVSGDIVEEGAFTSEDGVFEHYATVAEGMSGGPIFIEGKLLGIHQGYDYETGTSLGLRLSFAEGRPAARTAGYRDRTRHEM